MREIVVVSGLGMLSPLGLDVKNTWKRLINCEIAIKKVSRFDPSQYRCQIGAELPKNSFFEEYCKSQKLDRFHQYALLASQEAIEDAALTQASDLKQTAVVVGTGLGALFFAESQLKTLYQAGLKKTHPLTVPFVNPNGIAAMIARKWQCQGPNLSICTACSSSAHAMGQALDLIRSERAERVIVVGVESPFMPLTFAGFDSMRVLSTHNENPSAASRPFDKLRSGFVLGEGAAALVLEKFSVAKKRSAKIYAEFAGYGASNGAYHPVAPLSSGRDAAFAMKLALKDAGVAAESVDYINAHGTGTQLNDQAETKAIKIALGNSARQVHISSTKAQTGHLLGASAAIESIFTVMAIANDLEPATQNYQIRDPSCDLDYIPNQPRQRRVHVALSNAFAFGNNNAVLVFKRKETQI